MYETHWHDQHNWVKCKWVCHALRLCTTQLSEAPAVQYAGAKLMLHHHGVSMDKRHSALFTACLQSIQSSLEACDHMQSSEDGTAVSMQRAACLQSKQVGGSLLPLIISVIFGLKSATLCICEQFGLSNLVIIQQILMLRLPFLITSHNCLCLLIAAS